MNRLSHNISIHDPKNFNITSKHFDEPYNLPNDETFEYYILEMKSRLEFNEIQIPILTEVHYEIPGDIEFIKKINENENFSELRKQIMENVATKKYDAKLIATVLEQATPELIELLKTTFNSHFYIYNYIPVINITIWFLATIKSQSQVRFFISQFRKELDSIEISDTFIENVSENENEELENKIKDTSEDKNTKNSNFFAELNWRKLSTQAATLAISSICFKCGCSYLLPLITPFIYSLINNEKNNAIENSISNITEEIVSNNNSSNNNEKKSNILDFVFSTAKTLIKYFNKSE